MKYDVIVIGAGPAGLAAALGAASDRTKKVLLIERNNTLGGILNQCIHEGFGLHIFNEELTGPEYAQRYIDKVLATPNIEVMLNTNITKITSNKEVSLLNNLGIKEVSANSIIITTGCYERSRAKINLVGKRLAGIITAGAAQKFVNINGYLPGKKIVILGSGDIGLIMARRLTLSGAKVLKVIEINQEPSGLARNVKQCLTDFNIPLLLGYKITKVYGDERITGIDIIKIDTSFNEIANTTEHIACDTLLLSVGLIPFNKLFEDLKVPFNPRTNSPYVTQNYESVIPNIYLAGNNLHVNDLVDNVSREANSAGLNSIKNYDQKRVQNNIEVSINNNLNYVVPSLVDLNLLDNITFSFRVKKSAPQGIFKLLINNELAYKKVLKHLKPQTIENVKVLKNIFMNKEITSISIEVDYE